MNHELKTIPPYFQDVCDGRKTFEIRKDDRGFAVGDTLRLREWCDEKYTGREILVAVTYMTSYGQMPGMVVLGITPAGKDGE